MTSPENEFEEDIGQVPRCQECGSERVVKDAWARFNPEFGLWEIETVFEAAHCRACEAAATLTWLRQEIPPNQRIRELNDAFRTSGLGNGSFMLTSGLQERGSAFVVAAVDAVRAFDSFSEENDPWGEHDFGAIEIEEVRVFFKIDYYDLTLKKGSENPANEGETHRVLTVMLASEY